MPVAYDKSIYLTEFGFLLVVREDAKFLRLPAKTLEDAQRQSDMFPPDPGEIDAP